MPDLLQRATSGRAKCRGCGRAIDQDELRFGEVLPSPYREGDSVHWFHLTCGACMRPDKILSALRSHEEPMADRAWLERTAEPGVAFPRLAHLARAERSPSRRARCPQSRPLRQKESWPLPLPRFP